MTGTTVAEPWLWISFLAVTVFLLLFDLLVLHRRSRTESAKHALLMSVFWISIAMAFNLWFGIEYGSKLGLEMLTGYLVEESLSIDNVFVMLLIFRSFHIPLRHQHRALFWGIFGAIVMRATLIIVGAELVHRFHWVLYIFGVILIISGIKFLFETEHQSEITHHWFIRFVRKIVPVTESLHGNKFMVKDHGRMKVTPLFLAIGVIEASDLVFAVDSIPAVLAITQDSFVAFSSNIMAILGLRSLYFVVADFIVRFRYLKPGLAVILCFVGIKMLTNEIYPLPIWLSLLVIVAVLAVAGISSWYVSKREQR